MSVLGWTALLVMLGLFTGLAAVLELLRRELRELRRELRDWRHELPESKTRTVRQ